ncbi:MAG: DEAD/DEAH box helicase [Polyangiaceae bacterium]|nr:DEAD/DEAH box helicase [Polyangiaceae bacterium]
MYRFQSGLNQPKGQLRERIARSVASTTLQQMVVAHHSGFKSFHPCAKEWFLQNFDGPTKVQLSSWEPIQKGDSTLISAPTGSGKTLAAFFAAINRLAFEPPQEGLGVRVLYISPLKALAVDIERNLRAPLAGIAQTASKNAQTCNSIQVAVRNGDTSPRDRERMRRAPPEILITTPESLYLILSSKSRSMLEQVETVIIDEIHTMISGKRGSHLSLSLERLEELRQAEAPLQRIGLSATQRPIQEVASLLAGFHHESGRLVQRPVTIVDVGEKKKLLLRVESPLDHDVGSEEEEMEPSTGGTESGASHLPAIYPRLVELIESHHSTIIFVNSRGAAERMANTINELVQKEVARAHHGSLSQQARSVIEDDLKCGRIPALVATASLELGIDMGAVDLVVQVESPPSIASGLQRVGRAKHQVGGIPEGVIFPKYRSDLIACATATRAMLDGAIEESHYPRNPVDVLAQQVVAMVSVKNIDVDDLFAIVQRSAPFEKLPKQSYLDVLDMLSGRYPSDDFSELKPRITWDRLSGELSPRAGAGRIAIINGGTIPERGLYGVFLSPSTSPGSRRVGELDEEMVFESKVGDVILLGASSWRIEEITHDRVIVSPAPGEPGRLPFWHGDGRGRPLEFGRLIGQFIAKVATLPFPAALKHLTQEYCLEDDAARQLIRYLDDQVREGALVTDKQIVIERFTDDIGDRRTCVLSPFGAKVHAPWAMAVRGALVEERGLDIDVTWTDDGLVFRMTPGDAEPALEDFLPNSATLEDAIVGRLGETSLFAARFRENAGRALLLTKKKPGGRTPLWALRRRAATLLGLAARFRDFPIVLETYRECLQDNFDLPGLQAVLGEIERGQITIVQREVEKPSPFAASVLFSFVAQFMYQTDAPLAERRAQALTIDTDKLQELLGQQALRRLLDPEVIEEVESKLQRRQFPLRHADDLHDLLLSLGPLSQEEVVERMTPGTNIAPLLLELTQSARVLRVGKDTAPLLAAAEDAARLRDGLGYNLPAGLPQAFLEPVATPLEDFIQRHARTHGPFSFRSLEERFPSCGADLRNSLDKLTQEGRLLRGQFLPQGSEDEWVDKEVLQRLKRLSLQKLRGTIEPVPQSTLQHFALDWHQLKGEALTSLKDTPFQDFAKKERPGGLELLLDTVERLEGIPLPGETLESEILPRRLAYVASDLDQLCMAGEVLWQGVRGTTPQTGRIALYLSEHFADFARRPAPLEGELYDAIRGTLAGSGGVFFQDISSAVKGFSHDLFDALWQLIWNGEVSNDTLMPLRRLIAARTSKKIHQGRRPQRGSRRQRHPHARTPGTEGRFWLVSERFQNKAPELRTRIKETEQLLRRHGVLTRESLSMEEKLGGFSSVYPVLKVMEERGQIRRGFFVEGLGATQFATDGAESRLRELKSPPTQEVQELAATDPANLYGSVIKWPENLTGRASRSAGCRVFLSNGELVGFLTRSQKKLLTNFSDDPAQQRKEEEALVYGLILFLHHDQRSSYLLEEVNGVNANDSALLPALQRAGFRKQRAGLLWRAKQLNPSASHEEWFREIR